MEPRRIDIMEPGSLSGTTPDRKRRLLAVWRESNTHLVIKTGR